MYDEKTKPKADSPWSRFAKESLSPAFLPQARVVSSLRKWIAIGLFCFRSGKSLVLPEQCNARDVENSKLIGHRVTKAQVQGSVKGRCGCSGYRWPNDPSHWRLGLDLLSCLRQCGTFIATFSSHFGEHRITLVDTPVYLKKKKKN